MLDVHENLVQFSSDKYPGIDILEASSNLNKHHHLAKSRLKGAAHVTKEVASWMKAFIAGLLLDYIL